MFCSLLAFTQARPVTGKVTNKEGDPIPFATIAVKGTAVATSASQSGTFSINAKTGDILLITSQGYANGEFKVGQGTVVNATLTVQAVDLAEVVVSAG